MTEISASRLAEQIASHGMVGSSNELIDLDLVDGDIVAELAAERVLGVAVSAIDEGAMVGSDEVLSALIERHDQVMSQTMRIEIAAVRLAEAFDDSGIDHRFLKGVALAHVLPQRPSCRSYRDVDVLVPSASIDDAVALFMDNGATRSQPELRPGYDRRFAKSVTLRYDGVEFDIHRLLSPGPFGVLTKPSELFLLQRQVHIGGMSLRTLDPTDHLVHACYHVALGQVNPVLANLRDVALLATMEDDPVDMDRFDETITRWRGGAVVKRAVRIVRERLDCDLPDRFVGYAHKPVPAAEIDMLEPYLVDEPGGRFAALAPSTLKALPMADRPAYALAVGLPEGSDPVGRARDLLRRRGGSN